MLMINLAVLKLYFDDKNSFSIEKLKKTTSNKKVILQTNEEVLTNSLYMTSITTPEAYQLETWDIPNTGTRTQILEQLPLQNLMANKRDKIEHQGNE